MFPMCLWECRVQYHGDNHYINDCGYEGVNILNNNNSVADQSVMHLHIHIIPRKLNDNLHVFPNNKMEMDLDRVFNELKM